jgi:arabinose-5-phosphate isomerase
VNQNFIETAKNVLYQEKLALEKTAAMISDSFIKAVQLMAGITGKIICSGVGKSGHAARKVASTLSSLGTPAVFIHPLDAAHGDLGMVQKNDVFCLFSKSGASEEILEFLTYSKKHSIPVIALTCHEESVLWKQSSVGLKIPDLEEACILGLAPTSSVVAMIALGDALAITLSSMKKIDQNYYHDHHPGGILGQDLGPIEDIMHRCDHLGLDGQKPIAQALAYLSLNQLGILAITQNDQRIIGCLSSKQIVNVMEHHDKTFWTMSCQAFLEEYGSLPFLIRSTQAPVKEVRYSIQNAKDCVAFIINNQQGIPSSKDSCAHSLYGTLEGVFF